VAGLGLRDVLGFHEIDKRHLQGLVAVAVRGLALHDDARPHFQGGDGDHPAVLAENLRHADFFS
jgi:hypothetical protein